MKKKELFQQIGRLPEDTEITLANGEDFDVVKISRNGITNVLFDRAITPAPLQAMGCACACDEEPVKEDTPSEDQGN